MDDEIEYVYIYALIDPRDGEIRYIGKAKNLKKRLEKHISPPNLKVDNHKTNWIKLLKKLKLKPIIREIELVPLNVWEEKEKYWIKYYREQGCDLTNGTEGGEGAVGAKRSETTLEMMKISQQNRRNKEAEIKDITVNIYKKEIETIIQIKDYKKRYFLFALLYYAKAIHDYKCINNYVVENNKVKKIRYLARLSRNTSFSEIEFWYKDFYDKSLLLSDGKMTEILYAEEQNEIAFVITGNDDVINEYIKYSGNKVIDSCKICGKEIIKSSNIQKHCDSCKLELQRKQSRDRVRKLRKKRKLKS
jgi:hypothetical protein